ncbi:uncharacterized protein STAUR_7384 [Stigmatella aurantiaca DW4/3-1]|uniref:Uncharacterized protein n=1 Tax=Stigmatella aurantiaca (strain DW4/3-1) TaxID=378806 RepID=E3FEI4_STIAD|nr:uncharacterized protein STAUR_7384 [Stigmatella aurantiaca DW4/3-1]
MLCPDVNAVASKLCGPSGNEAALFRIQSAQRNDGLSGFAAAEPLRTRVLLDTLVFEAKLGRGALGLSCLEPASCACTSRGQGVGPQPVRCIPTARPSIHLLGPGKLPKEAPPHGPPCGGPAQPCFAPPGAGSKAAALKAAPFGRHHARATALAFQRIMVAVALASPEVSGASPDEPFVTAPAKSASSHGWSSGCGWRLEDRFDSRSGVALDEYRAVPDLFLGGVHWSTHHESRDALLALGGDVLPVIRVCCRGRPYVRRTGSHNPNA